MNLKFLIENAEICQSLLQKDTDDVENLQALENIHSQILMHLAAKIKRIKELQAKANEIERCNAALGKVKTLTNSNTFKLKTTVRNSIEAIYVDPEIRTSESPLTQSRKKLQIDRARRIRKLGCDAVVMASFTLPSSSWSRTSSDKFEYFLGNIPTIPQTDLPDILRLLEPWGEEPPLKNCQEFCEAISVLRKKVDNGVYTQGPALERTHIRDSGAFVEPVISNQPQDSPSILLGQPSTGPELTEFGPMGATNGHVRRVGPVYCFRRELPLEEVVLAIMRHMNTEPVYETTVLIPEQINHTSSLNIQLGNKLAVDLQTSLKLPYCPI